MTTSFLGCAWVTRSKKPTRKNGVTYVYEVESYWDKSRKQPRNKQVCIDALLASKNKFTLPVPLNNKWIQQAIDEIHETVHGSKEPESRLKNLLCTLPNIAPFVIFQTLAVEVIMNTQISELKKLLLKPPDKNNRKWTPFISPFTEKPARPTQAKKIACIIVAGGLGTRLNFHAPKGLFPILGKSLLQIFAEKAQVHPCMRLAIMTSSATDGPIRCHFAKQANFGLEDSQIAFFKQKDLPFLTPEGEPIDDPRGGLLQGPDGNGSALKELLTQGIWEQWHTQGVEYVNFLQIDNPLLDPFDPILAALLETHCAEVAVRCVKRLSTEEKVGILIERRKKIEILEYTEIDRPLDQAYANISNFCFRMDFIKRLESVELPLHIARKKVDGREVIKFEKFIFDCLPFSKKTVAFLDSRRNCFAPLKEASGTFGPDAVEKALKERIGYDQSRSERNRREKK